MTRQYDRRVGARSSPLGVIACIAGLIFGCGEPSEPSKVVPAHAPLGAIHRLHFELLNLRYPNREVLDISSDGVGCLDRSSRGEHLRLAFELPASRVQKLLVHLRKTNVEKTSFGPHHSHAGYARLYLEGAERTYDWVYRTPGNPAFYQQLLELGRLRDRLLTEQASDIVREAYDPRDPIDPDPSFAVPGQDAALIPCVRP